MAYRDLAHRQEVFRTPEYRRMASEWIANKSPVPLTVFQEAYGKAFWDKDGNTQHPRTTKTSQQAFMNIMIWTGRASPGTSYDEWKNDPDRGSP